MIIIYLGMLKKMCIFVDESNIVYYLFLIGDELVDINFFIGKEVMVIYFGEINCVYCNCKIKKSFN